MGDKGCFQSPSFACQPPNQFPCNLTGHSSCPKLTSSTEKKWGGVVKRGGGWETHYGMISKSSFKVKETACEVCGVSGLQQCCYRVAAFHWGANEAEGDQHTHNPRPVVAHDYSAPLIPLINVCPLSRSLCSSLRQTCFVFEFACVSS